MEGEGTCYIIQTLIQSVYQTCFMTMFYAVKQFWTVGGSMTFRRAKPPKKKWDQHL